MTRGFQADHATGPRYTLAMPKPDRSPMPREENTPAPEVASGEPADSLLTSCSLCGAEIAQRYPWLLWCSSCRHDGLAGTKLALDLGLVIGLSAAFLANGPLQAGLTLVFMLALAFAARIDANIQLLPDDVTLPLMWLGLLANWQGAFIPLPDAVLGAALGYVSLWSLYWGARWLTGQEALGHGDFKLTAAMGAWLGFQALPALLIGGALAHTAMNLGLRWRQKTQDTLPFGPALALAGVGAMAWQLACQAP